VRTHTLRTIGMVSAISLAMSCAAVSAHAEGADDRDDSHRPLLSALSVQAGYGRYAMGAFNRTEQGNSNNTISGGWSVALEGYFTKLKISDSNRWLGGTEIRLPVVGFEYLRASVDTTHAVGNNSATIEWNLPAVGVYVMPEIQFPGTTWLGVRPIELGWYWLGPNSNLTVSDRPGHLRLNSNTFGIKSELIAVKKLAQYRYGFVTAGYRWLRFNNVAQTPTNGFPVAAGNLRDAVDYSGAIVTAGVIFNL